VPPVIIIEKVMGIHDKYMLVAMYPKGPVIPNVRAEQAAAAALQEITDEQFMRVVKAEAARRRSGESRTDGPEVVVRPSLIAPPRSCEPRQDGKDAKGFSWAARFGTLR